MDKRYLKVFELYFQSKNEARKQKEAGEAVERSIMEQRRKTPKMTPTRRVRSKIREDKDSASQRPITIRGLRDGLDESIRIYKDNSPERWERILERFRRV